MAKPNTTNRILCMQVVKLNPLAQETTLNSLEITSKYFDFNVIYEGLENNAQRDIKQKSRTRNSNQRASVYTEYRVRNSAIFDHWILVKLKKTTIFQLSSYRIQSFCPTAFFLSIQPVFLCACIRTGFIRFSSFFANLDCECLLYVYSARWR